MEIEVDIEGIDSTLNEIKRDLHRGMEKSAETLVDNAKNRARQVINEENAIFNAEVYKGFKDVETHNSTSSVSVKLYNDVEHAEVLEDGAQFLAEGPPVEALLPWVARKMDWSSSNDFEFGDDDYVPTHFRDDDDSDDGGDGEDTHVERDSPDEDDSGNWNDSSRDYSEAKEEIPEGAIVKTKYGSAPLTSFNDGLRISWNDAGSIIRPTSTGFEVHEWQEDHYEFIDTVDSAQWFVPDDPDSIIGYKPGTDDDFHYDFYRGRDLPEGNTRDYERSEYRSYDDWKGREGEEVVWQDSDGLVHEGQVLEATDSKLTFVDYKTNFEYEHVPPTEGINSINHVIAVEDTEPPESRFYGYTKDDLSLGEWAFFDDTNTERKASISKLKDNEIIATDEAGFDYSYSYSQVIATTENHPVSDRLDNFQKGDRVTVYDRDADDTLDVILTGESSLQTTLEYEAIDAQSGNYIGNIPQIEFIEWESAPDVDSTKVKAEMSELSITSRQEAKDAVSYTGQSVVAYNPIEGDTKTAEVISSPWEDNYHVQLSDGSVENIDKGDWEVKFGVKFGELSKSEKEAKLDQHFDDVVQKSGGSTSDEEFIKDGYKEQIITSYKDDERVAEILFSWTELEISNGGAHVADGPADGWKLKIGEKPVKSDFQKTSKFESELRSRKLTLSHETGHAYSRPTPASRSMTGLDPEEARFAHMYKNRNDSSHSHMFDSGLPDWEFDSSNPSHAYAEAYMFTEGDVRNYLEWDSNGINVDNRDQMDPYGFDEWKDRVAKLAKADAEGKTLAQEEMDVSVTELTDKQVFAGDEYSIDEGDMVALEIDGEVVPHEVSSITAEQPLFNPNPNNDDAPTTANLISLESLDGSGESLYIGDDGIAYSADSSGVETWLEDQGTFIGKADVRNYDESLNEFPELTETGDVKRLQEAANMAWWYQAKHIEYDTSEDKERSYDKVIRLGYSSTNPEEVMATFTQAISHPDPSVDTITDFQLIARNYPFLVEEVLKDREPINEDVRRILENQGLI